MCNVCRCKYYVLKTLLPSFYTMLWYNVCSMTTPHREAIEAELLDDTGHDAITRYKEEESEFVEKIKKREEETGRKLEVVDDSGRDIKLPLKVMYDPKSIQAARLPIWYLQAMGSMSITEYNRFVKSNYDQLNLNEIAASDLLTGVIKKDSTAVARFWDLQKTLLKSKNVIQQVNNITISRDDAVRNIINDISDGLFKK